MAPQQELRPERPRDPGDDLAHAVLGPREVELFENLYAAYADDARRSAFRILHDRELAADATHTAYVELLRYILAGNRWCEPASARTAVLRNTNWAALKMLRTRRRRPEATMDAAAESSVDDTWARAEARALCEQVVDRLRPAHRAALRLRYVEGLSNAEAAERLAISVGAFEERLARGIRAARRVAAGIGLLSLVALARRRLAERLRPQSRDTQQPGLMFSAARLVAPVATVVAIVTAATEVPRLAPEHPASARVPTVALTGGTAGDALPDTPQTSVIIDGLRMPAGTVVLLGRGDRCRCGVVFTSRDRGHTWSAVPGPLLVAASDRLALVGSRSAEDVLVMHTDGSTYSSVALNTIVAADQSGGPERPPAVLPVRCPTATGRVRCDGQPVPWLASPPAWMLRLDGERALYVTSDGRLDRSVDGGAA